MYIVPGNHREINLLQKELKISNASELLNSTTWYLRMEYGYP